MKDSGTEDRNPALYTFAPPSFHGSSLCSKVSANLRTIRGLLLGLLGLCLMRSYRKLLCKITLLLSEYLNFCGQISDNVIGFPTEGQVIACFVGYLCKKSLQMVTYNTYVQQISFDGTTYTKGSVVDLLSKFKIVSQEFPFRKNPKPKDLPTRS